MSHFFEQNRAQLETLCRSCGVQRLEVFGSATTGLGRDLDFLVEFQPLPPGAYADAYFGLLESLERLYGKPVDLVVASAIRNPFFLQSIERTRTLLYAA